MNSSKISEPAGVDEPEKVAFGDALLQARESKGYTITEVSKATLLGEAVIDAIEKSDMKRLPPPTFVQGYLRTYARYLDMPEDTIVDGFNRAVPYKRESQLQPRPTLPAQATMSSPWIRSISILLILLVLFALIYGVYGHYARTVETIGLEKMDAAAFKIPEQSADTSGQNFAVSEPGGQAVDAAAQTNASPAESGNPPATVADNTGASAVVSSKDNMPDAVAKATAKGAAATDASASAAADTGSDVLDLKASDDSWVEITDAAGRRLYHDLMRKQQTLHLQGTAPFKVFLGNAPAVNIHVNGAEVKLDGHIRTNNVARFTVTTSEGNAVLR